MAQPEYLSAKHNSQQDLIMKYESVVFDYLVVMQSSETVKAMDDVKHAVQTGLIAITHIFKLAYYATKHASTSAAHCQKGAYCYIEYIEQMQKMSAAASQQIDYVDALTFIYDKTLSDLYLGSSAGGGGTSTFANILSVSMSHQAHGEDFEKCQLILDQLNRVCSSLIWIQNPLFLISDHLDIVNVHLTGFLSLIIETDAFDDVWLFLDTIQTHIGGITKLEYMDLLAALQKNMKRHLKRGSSSSLNAMFACLHLKTVFSQGMTLAEIGVQEKWKKPAEEIVKMAFC